MKDLLIIDADHCTFRCAAASENDPVEIAFSRLDEQIRRIIYETEAQDYVLYLGGDNNFRYELYPEYKANRKGKPKPKWLEQCREYLVRHFDASIENLWEADDACGIALTKANKEGISAVCASLDKDLLQVPGYHYNFVKGTTKLVSPLEGLRIFYKQLILGDRSDNIPGYDGKLRSETPKFIQKYYDELDELTEEVDMYKFVCDLYSDQVIWADNWLTPLQLHAQLLWIKRTEDDEWRLPHER